MGGSVQTLGLYSAAFPDHLQGGGTEVGKPGHEPTPHGMTVPQVAALLTMPKQHTKILFFRHTFIFHEFFENLVNDKSLTCLLCKNEYLVRKK